MVEYLAAEYGIEALIGLGYFSYVADDIDPHAVPAFTLKSLAVAGAIVLSQILGNIIKMGTGALPLHLTRSGIEYSRVWR
jgi:hypothetical protein